MEFKKELHLENNSEEEYRNIVMSFSKEFSKDKHKVNYNFHQKPNSLGLPYILIKDENGEIASYCCFDVHQTSSGLATTTHCLSVRPDYRGNKLSEIMISELEKACREKWNINYAYEICNEISTKSYKKCGFEETGSYRMTKSGERCLIRLKKEYK